MSRLVAIGHQILPGLAAGLVCSLLLIRLEGTDGPPTTMAQAAPDLTPFVTGFSQPVVLAQPPDASNRFFVVEQRGLIRVIENGAIASTFLNLSSKIAGGTRSPIGSCTRAM